MYIRSRGLHIKHGVQGDLTIGTALHTGVWVHGGHFGGQLGQSAHKKRKTTGERVYIRIKDAGNTEAEKKKKTTRKTPPTIQGVPMAGGSITKRLLAI